MQRDLVHVVQQHRAPCSSRKQGQTSAYCDRAYSDSDTRRSLQQEQRRKRPEGHAHFLTTSTPLLACGAAAMQPAPIARSPPQYGLACLPLTSPCMPPSGPWTSFPFLFPFIFLFLCAPCQPASHDYAPAPPVSARGPCCLLTPPLVPFSAPPPLSSSCCSLRHTSRAASSSATQPPPTCRSGRQADVCHEPTTSQGAGSVQGCSTETIGPGSYQG